MRVSHIYSEYYDADLVQRKIAECPGNVWDLHSDYKPVAAAHRETFWSRARKIEKQDESNLLKLEARLRFHDVCIEIKSRTTSRKRIVE